MNPTRFTQSMPRFLSKIFLLALLYVFTGKVGLLLAVPPGYATFIWPPSGIALGMLILHGWRLWPGILIGSFLLNSYISGAFVFHGHMESGKLLIALGIALGSTAQALVGRALVNRFFGLPITLTKIKDMLFLFLLSGPIACLIAATIAISTLYFSGILSTEKIISNWYTWWAGDTFGVMVFFWEKGSCARKDLVGG